MELEVLSAGEAAGGLSPIKGNVVEWTPWKDVVDINGEVEANTLLDTAKAAL